MSSIIKNTIRKQLMTVLEGIYKNPSILENKEVDKEIKLKLNASCNKKDGQGSANKATPHEINFAQQLEKENFQFLHKKHINQCDDGLYYVYQINGTQKTPDFSVLDIKDYTIQTKIDFDLKHSNTGTIFFNDGWFCQDTIYVISYMYKKEPTMIIGMGQDIPKSGENDKMMEIRKIKEELNNKYKSKDSNLKICFRFANQYKCDFTQNEREILFEKLKNAMDCESGKDTDNIKNV